MKGNRMKIDKEKLETKMAKNIRFELITQNQNTKEKAKKFAEKISNELKIETLPIIQQYHKFENSYRIEFVFPFDKPENSIVESLEKTDLICSPWIVKFDSFEKEIELIFNKTESSQYKKQYLNVILWAIWTTE